MWYRERGCFGSCLEFCLFCFFGVLFIVFAIVVSPLFLIAIVVLAIIKLIMFLVQNHNSKNMVKNLRKSVYCGMPCVLTFSEYEEYNLDNFSDLQKIPLKTGTTFKINNVQYSVESYLFDFARSCINAGNKDYGKNIIEHLHNHGLYLDFNL